VTGEAELGSDGGSGIAIVGIAVRLPGVSDTEALWRQLRDGRDAQSTPTDDQLRAAGVVPGTAAWLETVRRAYPLEDVDQFDARFFAMSPREADILDPQQRIMLECCWQALEIGGYTAPDPDVRVGVFTGSSASTYLRHLESVPGIASAFGDRMLRYANEKDYLATRIAYACDLHGPAVNVQTACSTALVAAHAGCQSLLNQECDVALVGGVSVTLPQEAGYLVTPGGMLSPTGRVRAFDAAADGTVFGNGAVALLLRRLDDAVASGDRIHAVIVGSAVNNDGYDKVSFAAPSVRGQAEVIGEALAVAGVDARDIGYVECHGTGTPLGDAIEITALTEAYRRFGPDTGFCRIGSAKTNFGHLDAASGALGLAKAALVVEHGEIPPTLHFSSPNPEIDFSATPFVVNDRRTPWPATGSPRRAAVSSFGVGGTNAHMILEQAPPRTPRRRPRKLSILLASARDPIAAETLANGLVDHVAQGRSDLADAAFTTQVGRRAFPYRRAVVATDGAHTLVRDRRPSPGDVEPGGKRSVVFLFPGQGTQYVNMARSLYESEDMFRAELDRCLRAFTPHLDADLSRILYPDADGIATATKRLDETRFTQPVLFAVEYALARQLLAWGVEPTAMAGHSLGEWVAACLAETVTLEHACHIISRRAALLQSTSPGAMLAVNLDEETVRQYVEGTNVDIAAINGAFSCTVAGPVAAVEKLERVLENAGVRIQRLAASRAFHSSIVGPILPDFRDLMRQQHLSPPKIPIISNVTGKRITDAEATDPDYWTRHVRQPVQFHKILASLAPSDLVVEVGPGRTLSGLSAAARPEAPDPIPLLGGKGDDEERAVAEALASLWESGADIDWHSYQSGRGLVRVPLPTYPFQRRKHWIAVSAPPSHEPHDPTPVPGDSSEPTSVESIEAEIAAMWTTLLGVPPESRDQDFFAAGGDSLLAVRLVTNIRATFQCDLALREVFNKHSLGGLTELVADTLLAGRALT
jgi:acyl transferase domain-containing protein